MYIAFIGFGLIISVIFSLAVRELVKRHTKNISPEGAVALVFGIWLPVINLIFLIIFGIIEEADNLRNYGK